MTRSLAAQLEQLTRREIRDASLTIRFCSRNWQ